MRSRHTPHSAAATSAINSTSPASRGGAKRRRPPPCSGPIPSPAIERVNGWRSASTANLEDSMAKRTSRRSVSSRQSSRKPVARTPDRKRSAAADLRELYDAKAFRSPIKKMPAQRQRSVAVARDQALRARPSRSPGARALLQRTHPAPCSGMDGRHAEADEEPVRWQERSQSAIPRHRVRAALGAQRRRSADLLRHQLSLALRLQGHRPRRIRIGRHHRAASTCSPQAMWSTGRPRAA